jgi:hypothetical protein
MHMTTETIDIGDDDTLQELRTDKRLNWLRDEDVRLVSYLRNFVNFQDMSMPAHSNETMHLFCFCNCRQCLVAQFKGPRRSNW